MDDNRRRQNEPPQYSGPGSRYGSDSDQSRGRGSYGGTDQYRGGQGSINPSTAAGRGAGATAPYGYYPDVAATAFPTSIPSTSMQYHSDYAPDQRHQHQHQQQQQQQQQQHHQQAPYGGYNSNMMYGVNQTAPQAGVYESASQFQQQQQQQQPQRQPTSMQIMPDVPNSYYPTEHSGTPNPALHPVLQHQSAADPTTAYQSGVPGYANSMAMAPLEQASITQLESSENVTSGSVSGGLEEAYAIYQEAIKQIFYNIQESKLAKAAVSVLEVSDWLLSNVSRLGLTGDNESHQADRLKLWNEFNQAWLTLLQRQKDMTQDITTAPLSMRPPPPPPLQNVISLDYLWKMSKDLVKLADAIEDKGLVDYQMGVWEEGIMDILLECIDILDDGSDSGEDDRPSRGGRAPA